MISLVLTTSLLSPPAERPLTVAVATQAQAADARRQVRPSAQTEPAATPKEPGMSRGKKIAIAVGVVAGAALIYFALDDDGGGGGDGSGGGGY